MECLVGGAFRHRVFLDRRPVCAHTYVDHAIITAEISRQRVITRVMGSSGGGPCVPVRVSRNRPHSSVVTRATVGCEALITSSWGALLINVVESIFVWGGDSV